jgi:uncharacterized protein
MKLQSITSFICGVTFAIGLVLAGMTQPGKIIGFLDVFGNWDPSLVFVLASAVGVYFVTYQFVIKRKSPLLAPKFLVPTKTDLELKLVIGGILFGVGWGMSGLCPGPILTTLGTGSASVMILMVTMLIGFYISFYIGRLKK